VGVFSSGEEENYFDIAIAIYAHDGSVCGYHDVVPAG
jgi:hypothetical protein